MTLTTTILIIRAIKACIPFRRALLPETCGGGRQQRDISCGHAAHDRDRRNPTVKKNKKYARSEHANSGVRGQADRDQGTVCTYVSNTAAAANAIIDVREIRRAAFSSILGYSGCTMLR